MNCVIFTGPTLSAEAAKNIVEATYLPPAKQGDIMAAIFTHHPDVIGIVDVCNDDALPVWHKEILFALENGILVYGSGGIGALRAIETERFGMIGVGAIFQRLKSQFVSSDDAVMSVYEEREGTFRRLSEPLVNIEATFESAVQAGIIDQAFSARLMQHCHALYYKDRNFASIFHDAEQQGASQEQIDALRAYCAQHYRDLQKEDALLLLDAIKTAKPERAESRYRKIIDPQDNVFLHVLKYRDREVCHQNNRAPLYAVADYIAVHHPEMDELMVRAKNRFLVGYLANLLRVEATDEEIERETQAFMTRYGLRDEQAFEEWLRQNDLIVEEFSRLMKENARMHKLHKALRIQLKQKKFTGILLDELILTNSYAAWAERACSNEQRSTDHQDEFVEEFQHRTLAECIKTALPGRNLAWRSMFMDVVSEAGFTPESLKATLIKAKLEDEALEKMAQRMMFGEDGVQGEEQ